MRTGAVLRAGAAARDITPPAGTHLAGSGLGEYRGAETVLDPLYAKVAVFEQGGRRFCVVALDTTIVTEPYTRRIRDAAAGRFGLGPDAVMVYATQTHSAPSMGDFIIDPDFPLDLPPGRTYLRGGEPSYAAFAAERAVEAIGAALERLQPVRIAAGRGMEPHQAFNRRGITRDGRLVMPWFYTSAQYPLGPTDLLYLEGPVDPEVGVFCARTEDMQLAAMLLHYTCHPVNLYARPGCYHAVSADWPGAMAGALRDEWGMESLPLVLNGCCGNLNPWDPFVADRLPDHAGQGAALAEVAGRVVRSLTFGECSSIDSRRVTIDLPFREVPAERLAQVEAILSADPHPVWLDDPTAPVDADWFLAATTRSIEYARRRRPTLPYEIQVFRLGDTALVGLSGEPFVEGQLAIKRHSPARYTFIAHCASHYTGYLPTREAAARGGHEANAECTYWAKLAPEALDLVVQATGDVLRELFPNQD